MTVNIRPGRYIMGVTQRPDGQRGKTPWLRGSKNTEWLSDREWIIDWLEGGESLLYVIRVTVPDRIA